MSSVAAITSALTPLRQRALDAAGRFGDYNFRQYFTKHAGDTFDGVEAKLKAGQLEEVSKFVESDGKQYVEQLDRMAAVNKMYTTTATVVDPRGGN